MSKDGRGKEVLIEEQKGREKVTVGERRRENVEISLELSSNYRHAQRGKRVTDVRRGGKNDKDGEKSRG